MVRAVFTIVFLFANVSLVVAQDFSTSEILAPPIGHGAKEPFLHVTQDGRLLMSWTEVNITDPSVMIAIFDQGKWTEPRTIINSPDLFLNWADFPSVVSFPDGTLIAHWLQKTGQSSYDYDVQIALSRDDGASWSAPVVPHLDGTSSQHGFVSLVAHDKNIAAVWLDGRAYDDNLVDDGAFADHMQLRSTILSSDGTASPDVALDASTCSCCQTDAAVAGESLLVVYRDRTPAEVRDIALVRLSEGEWSTPMRVHHDNWVIPGCPVNGPSISAADRNVVVAWFTGTGNIPAVKVAFSDDAGHSFNAVVQIDHGEPLGRVDTLMLEDGTALVSWVELDGPDEKLLVCEVTAAGCDRTFEITTNSERSSINFPQMAATIEALFIAWTQPLAGGTDTIRLLQVTR